MRVESGEWSSLTLAMTNDELLLELRVESGEWSSLSLTITNDELLLELRVEFAYAHNYE